MIDFANILTTLAQQPIAPPLSHGVVENIGALLPEIILLIGGTICLITGLGREDGTRKATSWIAGIAILVAIAFIPPWKDLSQGFYAITDMVSFIKLAVCIIGFILLLVCASVPDLLPQTTKAESAKKFEPEKIFRGEFFAFFLFSLTGVMLTAGAKDLIWLFLALELTSLPTYVMVASARKNIAAQEAGVKYFFLGALSAAIFLYGFAFIYGATGYTDFQSIATEISRQVALNNGHLPGMLLIGLVLAIIGLCFKIAAFPMHYYAADVYEGASSAVTAFLAFVPKTAGFAALILILTLVGWKFGPDANHLPPMIDVLLWFIAVITMTVGNVLAVVQSSVKRALAYSSVAHSGYMIVGLLAGPALLKAANADPSFGYAIGDGLAAIIFYLIAYGLATVGSFAVLACLRNKEGEEVDRFDELGGLVRHHPLLAGIMALSVLSLLGIPPMVGFLGKIYLFGSAYEAGFYWLVIIGVLNTAISGAYYLRIAAGAFFAKPTEGITVTHTPGRIFGAFIGGVAALALGFFGGSLIDTADRAAEDITTQFQIEPQQTNAEQSLVQK
ncbi:NADH-quinone oxidoreductase subunit N [Poriferisphaera sp. WC338]|uniref:NADH-quinone oxidoreductase subunit N n=1 Tax=Poriferisphaera sp. WC338 TaxID=3425129 RepID=UPI003D815E78